MRHPGFYQMWHKRESLAANEEQKDNNIQRKDEYHKLTGFQLDRRALKDAGCLFVPKRTSPERNRTGSLQRLLHLWRVVLKPWPGSRADRRYRNALVSFIKRRGVIELRHFRLTCMMQRDDAPVFFVEHRTAGVSPFGRCPIVHAAVAARDHDVVVEGEGKPASASVPDDVQPPSPLTWQRHRQRFV